MKALKYSCMILLSVFISCSSDDDDDHHDEPNWVRHLQQRQDPPQESAKYNVQSVKLIHPPGADDSFVLR